MPLEYISYPIYKCNFCLYRPGHTTVIIIIGYMHAKYK